MPQLAAQAVPEQLLPEQATLPQSLFPGATLYMQVASNMANMFIQGLQGGWSAQGASTPLKVSATCKASELEGGVQGGRCQHEPWAHLQSLAGDAHSTCELQLGFSPPLVAASYRQ